MSNFFSMILRMKYITRWGLMRNTRPESLSEHTLDTAILVHSLCTISNKRLNGTLDSNKAVMLALFHDASEIITGDMPTPIKYQTREMINAYKQAEASAVNKLFCRLPEDFKDEYSDFFYQNPTDEYLWRLVKAADKLSALIKCIDEEKCGNTEFSVAKTSTIAALKALSLPEVEIFLSEFFDGFTKTLDEQ